MPSKRKKLGKKSEKSGEERKQKQMGTYLKNYSTQPFATSQQLKVN